MLNDSLFKVEGMGVVVVVYDSNALELAACETVGPDGGHANACNYITKQTSAKQC